MNRSLNLMPESSTRRRITSEAIKLWLRVLVAVSVLAGGIAAMKMWHRSEDRQRLTALEAQHAPIKQLRGELKLLKTRINAVRTGDALALAVADAPSTLALLSGVVEASASFQGEACLNKFCYRTQPLSSAAADQPRLIVEGLARDPSSIQRFVDALKASGHFVEVKLSETEARLLRGTATTAFEVECLL